MRPMHSFEKKKKEEKTIKKQYEEHRQRYFCFSSEQISTEIAKIDQKG